MSVNEMMKHLNPLLLVVIMCTTYFYFYNAAYHS